MCRPSLTNEPLAAGAQDSDRPGIDKIGEQDAVTGRDLVPARSAEYRLSSLVSPSVDWSARSNRDSSRPWLQSRENDRTVHIGVRAA
jgi:hypothetical protein